MRLPNRRAWSGFASVLVLGACLEPNPNDVGDEAATGGTSTDTGVAETGTAADTTTTDATTDTTGSAACGDIVDPEECTMAGCQVVNGSKLKENGPDSPCLEPSEFLGCIPEQGCDDALTWFCQGNGTYQVPNSCGPEGFDPCEGPTDPLACP